MPFWLSLRLAEPRSRAKVSNRFLDALGVKIRNAESRQVTNKVVYVALGVPPEGEREVLGCWIATNEGAKFWL
jgi:putative transposase